MKILRPESTRVPIQAWADFIEDGAMVQAVHVASLPFTFHHVVVLSDVHQGYGVPIGCVAAFEGFVSPSAVGLDIGCGAQVAQTNIRAVEFSIDRVKAVLGKIRERVPVGFTHQATAQPLEIPTWGSFTETLANEAKTQVGTLGGGNHFIELQKDTNGLVWVMIHSGSRNVGKRTADHYNEIAVNLNERSTYPPFAAPLIPKAWQLASLPIGSPEGTDYWGDMSACLAFALANRTSMVDRVLEALSDMFGTLAVHQRFDIHHNYAAIETHFGQQVIVHRKGATAARAGELGIIPGSQGTKSYIVRGLGNPESFESCSHGAGRAMSRTQAKKELNLQDEIRRMDEQGIVHGLRNQKDLDEAAGAYKPINEVMAQQTDLVEIVETLTPMGVIKG
jgi:tRNA-splicing ligase RtcB